MCVCFVSFIFQTSIIIKYPTYPHLHKLLILIYYVIIYIKTRKIQSYNYGMFYYFLTYFCALITSTWWMIIDLKLHVHSSSSFSFCFGFCIWCCSWNTILLPLLIKSWRLRVDSVEFEHPCPDTDSAGTKISRLSTLSSRWRPRCCPLWSWCGGGCCWR